MPSLRHVVDLPPAAVAAVDGALSSIEREHDVRIPLAVESGSRAWGFPSPTSDFDCRFVFVRPAQQLVSLWPPRDVIELPPEAELDINGWDLGKALRLLLKGNAVIIEWLMSPIVYKADAQFRDELLSFAQTFVDAARLRSHYLHLGSRQRTTYFADGKPVQLKKLFYALRPAAALRWMRLHPGRTVPPMHFPTLGAEGEWPEDAADLTNDLLERKAVSREMGEGSIPLPLARLIDAEFEKAEASLAGSPLHPKTDAAEAADRLFRMITRRMD